MPRIVQLDPREQHFRIPADAAGTSNLFIRYLGPAQKHSELKVALYVHGATFPSALSIAHRFDGRSWRDDLNSAGFHVWGLDFLGYGGSDRYPAMCESPEDRPALGRAAAASEQVEKAVHFILQHHQAQRISIIAHSWGTMAAALFTGRRPDLIDRLAFFAPIAQRSSPLERKVYPAWRLISLQEQWDRFVEDVPAGEPGVLSRRHFEEWGSLYLDTDEESGTRSPASVKIPSGPLQEIAEAQTGHLAYDPSSIKAPVAIVRGEWDHLVTDDDARWLFKALRNSPIKRDIKISRATHLMHLESGRCALYRETQQFLDGGDLSSMVLCEKHEKDGRNSHTHCQEIRK